MLSKPTNQPKTKNPTETINGEKKKNPSLEFRTLLFFDNLVTTNNCVCQITRKMYRHPKKWGKKWISFLLSLLWLLKLKMKFRTIELKKMYWAYQLGHDALAVAMDKKRWKHDVLVAVEVEVNVDELSLVVAVRTLVDTDMVAHNQVAASMAANQMKTTGFQFVLHLDLINQPKHNGRKFTMS